MRERQQISHCSAFSLSDLGGDDKGTAQLLPMGSRSKLMLELVAQKNDDDFRNSDHIVNENIESINETRSYSNEKQETTQNNQEISQHHHQRTESTSSSSSRSSSGSSSSSFYEDSDDSVKDPDYQDPTLLPENLSLSVFEHLNSSPSVFEHLSSSPSAFVYENLSASIFEQENLLSDIEHESSTPPLTEHENSTPPLSEQQNLIPTETGIVVIETPTKKGKKRLRQESSWKKNVAKKLRNSGKSYQSSKSKKEMPERKLKPPCKEICKFKCRYNITETQ
ncbi:uncharacterized protein LOC126891416 [Diabrotica virgifera virgifera]|uniref:Suppressor protein SRP40-like n=1 Tax=Diabrotica virgifera virgifera TaxID=50390 RepID=A0ABM5L275_DIAVI|nr:uncharacterized protein LOC126891416 [Diabrotica virgifera virgifera]